MPNPLKPWFPGGLYPFGEPSGNQEKTPFISPMKDKLKFLVKSLDSVAKRVGSLKEPAKGPRNSMGILEDFLIRRIGILVKFLGRPLSHTLPIARVVHEWATNQVVGYEWGERRFHREKKIISRVTWAVVDGTTTRQIRE